MALGVIAVLCLVVGAASEHATYRTAVITRSLVTPADLTVLHKLEATTPSTTVVMTDSGNDAGFWLAGLTDLTPMVPNGFDYGILSLPLDMALANACTDPATAAAAIAGEAALTNASMVFVGAHLIPTADVSVERRLHRPASQPSADHVGAVAGIDGSRVRHHRLASRASSRLSHHPIRHRA